MGSFSILDKVATEKMAKFVSYHGAICANFADIVLPYLPNQNYFAQIRAEFATHYAEIQHQNEQSQQEVDIELATIRECLNPELFKLLPKAIQEECSDSQEVRSFLISIGRGFKKQLYFMPKDAATQRILRTPGVIRDWSGRTFYCTGFEYAYWAKDIYLCKLLEKMMDSDTKAFLLERITKMERIDTVTGREIGLKYYQNDNTYRSAHFDFTPLKDALHDFANHSSPLPSLLMKVGQAQLDVPLHVAQEYCEMCRPFFPTPQFNQEPNGDAKFDNCGKEIMWFNKGPIAITRGDEWADAVECCASRWGQEKVAIDLAAITQLDKVRSEELIQLRERLSPSLLEYTLKM